MENEYTYIYAILLTENKIFIHPSPSTDSETIFNEFHLLYDYSITYSPLKILDAIFISEYENNSDKTELSYSTVELNKKHPKLFLLEIDTYVKKYMILYGIENVRGGNYCDEFLDDNTIQLLKEELNVDTYENQRQLLQQYKDYKDTDLNEEIKQLEKYRVIKNAYDHLRFFDDDSEFNKETLEEFEWLYEMCIDEKNLKNRSLPENIKKYRNLISRIKQLSKKYESFDTSIKMIEMKYSEFVFDHYFYHKGKSIPEEERANIWEKMEILYYTIHNRIQEFEFDLEFFPRDIEKLVAMKIRQQSHEPVKEKPE